MTAIERAAESIDAYLDDKGITLGDDEVRELAAIIKRELEKAVPAFTVDDSPELYDWNMSLAWVAGANKCRKAFLGEAE